MAGTLTVGREPGEQLPEVRQDLTLYQAASDEDGTPQWHLHDPLANRYFRLQQRDIELLGLLGNRNARQVSRTANNLLRTDVTEAEIDELVGFLRINNLVRYDEEQREHHQHTLQTARQREWWEALIRNPIFFRIPLWHPDSFLERTLPYVRWMGTRSAGIALVLTTLLGFYLLSRQLDSFLSTFLYFFSWSGLTIYLATLFFVKILHELGHAYVAKAMGCRVPVIGVAFLVGWPVFYTDTSDAWKIADRKKRMAIGVAGVSVELAIASLSLLLWSVTPDGSMRSAFFLLASTTWILSLAVNFNPLMRFDGYYLASDLFRVPNLEKRAFDMARWWMREKLFGLGDRVPETFRAGFVVFAFSVWLYRFFLFFGIALIVYSFFFKAAGIALFIAELVLLIGRPVYNEVNAWWKFRERISWNTQTIRSLMLLGVLGLVLFVPWRTDLSAPALITGQVSDIYLPESGQLSSSRPNGDMVTAGQILFQLKSPHLEQELAMVRQRYDELRWTLSSLGFNTQMRSQAMVVDSALRTQNQRLRSLFEKRQRLDIKAPFDGWLVDTAPDIRDADWLPKGMKIATVVDLSAPRITAYLKEQQLSRVAEGMQARFYPENPEFDPVDATVQSIDYVGAGELDQLYLASLFGGDIAVRESNTGALTMVESLYRIKFTPADGAVTPQQVVRGEVVIEGHPISIFTQVKRVLTSVLLRETSF